METFVIRLWTDDDTSEADVDSGEETAERGLRGIVRHVRTGTETPFADSAELLVTLATLGRVARPVDRLAASRVPTE
ncbi:MAG TPA: hypothetical protein VGQ64_06680 [Candidatus Limnocylindrales bacterium]|jgi:hypothetical protein|nr:hypothetical protein [Candidatus Limnocylindrales bacterium]